MNRLTPRRRARGFSLLEVLVAFAILAISLAIIMRIFSQGLGQTGESDAYARAVTLAESKISEVGPVIPLEEGETDGEEEGGLRWHLRITDYDPEVEKAGTSLGTITDILPARLLKIEVEVAWGGEGPSGRSIKIATVKTAQREVL